MSFIKDIKCNSEKFIMIFALLLFIFFFIFWYKSECDFSYNIKTTDNSVIEELSKNECLNNVMLNFVNKGNVIRNINIEDLKYQCSPKSINNNKESNELYILQNKFINNNIKK